MPDNVLVSFYLEPWALHWNKGRIIDLDIWRETVAWFGGTGLICIHELEDVAFDARSKTDILPPVYLSEANSQLEAEVRFADYHWVYCDPQGKIKLEDFDHPTGDVVYSLGPDSSGFVPNKSNAIRIPCVKDIGSIWSISAAAVILYHRASQLQIFKG